MEQITYNEDPNPQSKQDQPPKEIKIETATFGAGCFWCVEAIFQDLRGVEKVESGYAGGEIKNPTYQEVSSGLTNHAEVCQLTYDANVISFEDLLEVFWYTHDPTTLNKQGYDVGTQYRSVIFYHNNEQKELAERSKAETDKSELWHAPIVTIVEPYTEFYVAEDYHQDYYNLNSNAPYCSAVISPKLEKFMKKFADKVKSDF